MRVIRSKSLGLTCESACASNACHSMKIKGDEKYNSWALNQCITNFDCQQSTPIKKAKKFLGIVS